MTRLISDKVSDMELVRIGRTMRMLRTGLSIDEIANKLKVPKHTVKAYVTLIEYSRHNREAE